MKLYQAQNSEKELKQKLIIKSNESLFDLIRTSEKYRKEQSEYLS